MSDRIVKDREEPRPGGTPRGPTTGAGHEEPIVETREEARQGETRAPMQWVLIGSVALVVIAFAIVYFAFFG